jgi:hypothetical protein
VVAVGFTYLALHAIAVYGMVETLLGNADEHLNGCLPFLVLMCRRGSLRFLTLMYHIDGPERIDCHRMALVAAKQFINQFLADDALTFPKLIPFSTQPSTHN